MRLLSASFVRFFRLVALGSFVFMLLMAARFYADASLFGKKQAERPDRAKMLEGVIVARFASDTGLGKTGRTAALQTLGILKQSPALPFLQNETAKTAAPLQDLQYLYFDVAEDPWEMAQKVQAIEGVTYAEPKYLRKTDAVPNDPQYANMTEFGLVQAEAAWELSKGQNGQVVIAVVDGGTDWQHPDLKANVWINPREVANNRIDDDQNGFVDDVNGWNFFNSTNDPTGSTSFPNNSGHGTHVAGTAAGVTHNSTGIASLSWNAKLLPINVASKQEDDRIAYGFEGIAYAALMGAHIISCSWGDTGSYSQAEQDVIEYARSKGSLVIAAAGNEATNNDLSPHYPASLKGVLSVGATGSSSDIKASYSNYGLSVDVFAPGNRILSTYPNNNYTYLNGTSMATPMVSALAALIKTQKPTLSPDQLAEQIRVTADQITNANPSYGNTLGGGRINAKTALTHFNLPSLRIQNVRFTDLGNADGQIQVGETIQLSLQLKNILANATNVKARLTSPDQALTPAGNTVSIGDIASDQSQTFTGLSFKVEGTKPDGYVLRLVLELTTDQYTDRALFTLVLNPPRFISHNTGRILTSMTTRGNIGYNGFQDTQNGDGFKLNGKDLLFEGGLMIGRNQGQLSDCIRGADGSTQDNDFQPIRGNILQLTKGGKFAYEESTVLLSDSLAVNPLYLKIEQNAFADTLSANKNFVIVRYRIKNLSKLTLTGLHAGLFTDWDLSKDGGSDVVNLDEARRMGYVADHAATPSLFAATQVLTKGNALNFRAISNNPEIYGSGCTGCNGFQNTEKWSFLSGGIQTRSIATGKDVSTLIGSALPSLAPNQTIELAFAILAAPSLAEVQKAADRAQLIWDQILTPIDEDRPLPTALHLAGNYPNPFNPSTQIHFSLPQSAFVELSVFDVLGRKIASLVHETKPAGTFSVPFDGQNLASGTYLYRLTAQRSGFAPTVLTRKMLLVK